MEQVSWPRKDHDETTAFRSKVTVVPLIKLNCTTRTTRTNELTTYFRPLMEHSLNCISFSVSVPVLSVNTYSTC